MKLNEVRKEHGLSLKEVADLLGLKFGTVNNYCSSISFVRLSDIEAEKLDAMIETAYTIAAKVMKDDTVREVAIKAIAKHIVAMGFDLSDEAKRIFSILSS